MPKANRNLVDQKSSGANFGKEDVFCKACGKEFMGSWLQEVTILILVYELSVARSDLLESFRPKEDNPPELNEFLATVLSHRTDFGIVRKAARKYAKMKKDIQSTNLFASFDNSMDPNNGFEDGYKMENKRNIHHHSVNRRFRNPGVLSHTQGNKFQRTRRGVKKRMSESSETEDEIDDREKRYPEIIMFQQADQKHIVAPKSMQAAPKVVKPIKKKKHKEHTMPSEMFVEPSGESLQKRAPDEIEVESEGETGTLAVEDGSKRSAKEKKQAYDLSSAVHRTYKSNPQKMRNQMKAKGQGDFYYIDLQDAAERDTERYGDRRRYGWDPHRQSFYYRPPSRLYSRPYIDRRPAQNLDYPQYEMGPHHSLNDEVAFEKALSYEIEPKRDSFNNPAGNNLYSVDEGRADNIEPLYQPGTNAGRMQGYGKYDYSPDSQAVTNERFFIDSEENPRKIDTTTESSTADHNSKASEEHGSKAVKHVGNGFIEVTKSRRDNQLEREDLILSSNLQKNHEDDQQSKDKSDSNILAKHSLHPLRVKDTSRDTQDILDREEEDTRSLELREANKNEESGEHFLVRKLQFIDDAMTNFYNQDEDYEEVPNRPRRDFLDALGMKNEEDYTEDNPYQNEINVNNTDVQNDTYIHKSTTQRPCSTTIKAKSSKCYQTEDIKNIKKILEEPTSKSEKRQDKRVKKSSDDKNFNNFLEDNAISKVRGTDEDVGTKILQNKDKIYNTHEDNRVRKFNNNHVQVREERTMPQVQVERTMPQLNLQEERKVRQERTMPQWSDGVLKVVNSNVKKSIDFDHNIDKKEDGECLNDATTVMPPSNCTSTLGTANINSNYEQVAHQMDIENEKLAQVVNGHLASKIVSTVFDELRKKASLKAKFYSGLSRKHVNYAGTIDFDIFKANETEDVDEARLLLDQITKVLNRLVLNQVRRKLCQRLPDELKDYLDILLNIKNTLETTNFEPNTQQGDFLFTYQEGKNEPPFDLQKLQNTLVTLEGLLLSYNHMNEDCQNRAEPVKSYIEKHVKMLKQIVSCPDHNCEAGKFTESKRDAPIYRGDLVEKQLESVGLGRKREFIPNFDVNQMVKSRLKAGRWKSDKKRDTTKNNGFKSQQYRKLQIAAEKIREKRENERKLAALFDGKLKGSLKKLEVDYEEPVVYSLG